MKNSVALNCPMNYIKQKFMNKTILVFVNNRDILFARYGTILSGEIYFVQPYRVKFSARLADVARFFRFYVLK